MPTKHIAFEIEGEGAFEVYSEPEIGELCLDCPGAFANPWHELARFVTETVGWEDAGWDANDRLTVCGVELTDVNAGLFRDAVLAFVKQLREDD